MSRPVFAEILAAHLPRDRYDEQGEAGGTYCTCGDWTGDYFADGEAGPFDAHLAAVLNAAVDAWLADEETREAVADALWTENARLTMPEFRNMPDAEAKGRFATAALAALTQREDTP
jgi:hypothetical protein